MRGTESREESLEVGAGEFEVLGVHYDLSDLGEVRGGLDRVSDGVRDLLDEEVVEGLRARGPKRLKSAWDSNSSEGNIVGLTFLRMSSMSRWCCEKPSLKT